MTQRAEQVATAADDQIEQLLDHVSQETAETLRRPCPGRQKLGDGTVGALISHTADNYQRIADFATNGGQQIPGHGASAEAHKMGRFLRVLGHRPPDHGGGYSADAADPEELAARLTTARGSLARIATLNDQQLDTVPPDGSFRFCDGKRTLEEVVGALLKHQGRQLDAVWRTIE